MTYFVRVNYPDTDTLSTSCFDWTIQQIFDYTNRGIIKLTLNLEQLNCGQVSEFDDNPASGIMAIIVALLAITSLILSVKYFFSISKMYKDIREKYIEKEEEFRQEAEIH